MALANPKFDDFHRSDEMVRAALDYCALVEDVDAMDSEEWLPRMAALLPSLHAAVVSLGNPRREVAHLPVPDFEERFELFSRLRQVLGERDAYWLEFDVAQDGQSMSGSLADDLTDIYFELRHGLELLDHFPADPFKAICDWQLGYELHWGQHLVDAERHFYTLRSRNEITS